MDALHPDRPDDDPRWVRCAVYTRQSVKRATLERPRLAKLLRRIEEGDVRRVIVYRVDRLTRKLADLARLAEFFERHRVHLTIVLTSEDRADTSHQRLRRSRPRR